MKNDSLAVRHCLFVGVLSTLLFSWIGSNVRAESPSLAASMPGGAIAYTEISGLAPILEELQHSNYRQMAISSPQFQAFEKSPSYQKAQAVRQIIETQLGMDLWTASKKLLGGQLALAVYPKPGRNTPDAVLLIRVADDTVLAHVRERLEPFVTLLSGDQVNTSEVIAGEKSLVLKGPQGEAFIVGRSNWVAAASTRELLKKSIGLLKGSPGGSLAEDGPFHAMTKDLGSQHLIRGYLNTEMISQTTGGRFAPQKLDNALASLMFGGIVELAVRSPYAGATLDVDKNQFVLTTGIAGGTKDLGEKYQPFFSDPANSGTQPIPNVPDLIGGFTLYRNFADWYQRRDELLQDKVLPGFDKFEAGLANLLPGQDFGEDVLPLIGKRLTFVAARQDYDYLNGSPGVKLPGFGLIVELAKPKEGADVIQLFFQTFSSLLNIQAGQQGRKPWVMGSESYKDVQISFGRYLQKPTGDRLPFVFNFMPAAARVDDKYIISSSLGLCRNLIDELTNPTQQQKRENKNLNFEFFVGPFAEILQANKEFFHARSVQNGRELKQAQAEFEYVMNIVRSWDAVNLSTSITPSAFQVQLRGSWK